MPAISFGVIEISLMLTAITFPLLAAAGHYSDNKHSRLHPNADPVPIEPKLIQQPAGYDVRLNCGIRKIHTDYMNQSIVHWDYKKCNVLYNHQNCDGDDMWSRKWTPLKCADEPCGASLLIEHPGEAESGLYRCSIQPYRPDLETTLQIQVVKTYQLDIINLTMAAPELLDDLPANTTALHGSQVVLQCRVRSKDFPTIKWFRKQNKDSQESDDLISDPGSESALHSGKVLQFLENTYEHLESAGEKGLTEDTYLSKLIFNRVSDRDTGTYVCVGINYRGYTLREAHLSVVYSIDEADGNEFESRQLMLLFLIPFGLAMFPLTMWCCYLMCRSRVAVDSAEEQQKKLTRAYKTKARRYSFVCQNEVYV